MRCYVQLVLIVDTWRKSTSFKLSKPCMMSSTLQQWRRRKTRNEIVSLDWQKWRHWIKISNILCLQNDKVGQPFLIYFKANRRTRPAANELMEYHSQIHNAQFDVNGMHIFLKKEVPLNEFQSIRNSNTYAFHKKHIRLVILGLYVWNHHWPEAVSTRHLLLTKYSTYLFTQYNNGKLVKVAPVRQEWGRAKSKLQIIS